MPGRGPPPKPTVLRAVGGNAGHRPLNVDEPKPEPKLIPPPDHIEGESLLAWNRLAPMLHRMGVLTTADELALERLCEIYAGIMACDASLQVNGRTYWSESENGASLLKANPAAAQKASLENQLKTYLQEFGLTPAARSRVKVATAQNGINTKPTDRFFKSKA